MTNPAPSLFDEGDPPEALAHAIADVVARYGYQHVVYEVERHRPMNAVPSAPARRTDPETSHLASPRERDLSRFGSNSRQAKMLAAFHTSDLTAQQAAFRVVGIHATPSALDGCRRRCSDLLAAGLIFDSGKRAKNPGSDELSIVWSVTLAGVKALANLGRTGWSK